MQKTEQKTTKQNAVFGLQTVIIIYLNNLLDIPGQWDSPSLYAATAGSLECLKYAHEHGDTWQSYSWQENKSCVRAAELGVVHS